MLAMQQIFTRGMRVSFVRFPLCTSVSSVVKTSFNHREHRGAQGKFYSP
jgi:hypothetical protein